MFKKVFLENKDKTGFGPVFFEFDSNDGELKNGLNGYGQIIYPEGSIYTGQVTYVNGNLNKYGFGEQDFKKSDMRFDLFGQPIGMIVDKFVGFYNYLMTDWIYGNGIAYFTDEKGNPTAYMTGYFHGSIKVKEWEGVFSKDLLLETYRNLPEIKEQKMHQFRVNAILDLKKKFNNKAKTLLLGDSWFEFYETWPNEGTYALDTVNKSVLDLGVGGSTFKEYNTYIDDVLKDLEFEQVIVNLGYNDLHCLISPEDTCKYAKIFFDNVRKYNKNAKIYLLEISHSPAFPHCMEVETITNEMLVKLCEKENVIHINTNHLFTINGKFIEGITDYFVEDKVHLNRKGYLMWSKLFKDLY